MIEQVLYRRTAQGYVEYFSGGLSKEEAHKVNIVMDKVASGINDLGSGADSPFLLYPFDTMKRFCLAIFQKEYSGGRSNSVNHGLLIDEEEYKELVKDPDQIWGFTNKNFLSRKVNSRNEMPGLKALDISENFELNKDFIFKEYNLKNSGYLKFLNAVYMSLSKNRNYQFGIQIDNSKDANKVMRHFGYLITSMLPYELRDKVSFCSRNVPESIKVTLRILTEKDTKKTDIIYDINTAECILSNSNLEIIDFYLSDLLEMSDLGLREYFTTLDAFRNELKVSKDSEAQYAVLKLLKLSQNPSLFALETAQNQIAFINDVFSLETSNTDVINSIVVRLLPFVDSKYYIEAFNLNFELYGKLDSYKESDKRIMAKVEENIIQNYSNATVKEREQLFKSVFSSGQTHKKVQKILENFAPRQDICPYSTCKVTINFFNLKTV